MTNDNERAIVYIVDDDCDLGASLARLLNRSGYAAEPFTDPRPLLDAYTAAPADCILTDVMMGDLDGFGFADKLRDIDAAASIIFMTAWPTVSSAVDSIRRYGGVDYLEKPIDEPRLLAAIDEGVAWSRRRRAQLERTARLTPRERDVFALLVRGLSSKAVAAELNLSPKTVEDHRAQIAAKTGTSGLAQLIELSGEA
ncbi:MAG: response regulator [Sphingomonas bacterium]|nr:response regulator [Sphingomonas bacterium]